MNILNPALTARAFCFCHPIYMSGDKVWVHNAMVDGHSGSTILESLRLHQIGKNYHTIHMTCF